MAVVFGATIAVSAGEDELPSRVLDRIERNLDSGRFASARALIESSLERAPNHAELQYAAARCFAQLGDRDRAAEHLLEAVRNGFRDFERMERQRDLVPIRGHEVYRAILEARRRAAQPTGGDEQVTAPADDDGDDSRPQTDEEFEAAWRDMFDLEVYRYEVDREHNLVFVNTLDDTSHEEMRAMLEAQAEHLIDAYFEQPLTYRVMVAIPKARDAGQFIGQRQVGGFYEPAHRRLVSRNIGGSLRHEFFHVYHHHHMQQLDQRHPLWIQEGLACLYEDYDLQADGSVYFHVNERHNVIKRRLAAGRTLPWEAMFEISRGRFMQNARTLYPQAWSMFRFVAEKGHLETWYDTYVRTYDDDPTGQLAFEEVFGKPLEEIERRWKQWLAAQPMLDNVINVGDATLGVLIDDARSVDGAVVQQLTRNGAARDAGVRPGDVIVSIDNRPTRSFDEVINIIGPKSVGDSVVLRLRRGDEYNTLRVRLRAYRP